MRKIKLLSLLSAAMIGGAAAALCPVFLYGFATYQRWGKGAWFLGVFLFVSTLSYFISKQYITQYVVEKRPLREQQIIITIMAALLFLILGEMVYVGNASNQYSYPTEVNVQITSNSRDFNFDTNPILLFLSFGDSFGKNTDMKETITEDDRSILHYQGVVWAAEDLSLLVKTKETPFDVLVNLNGQSIELAADDLTSGSYETKLVRKNFPPYTSLWKISSSLLTYRFVFLFLVGGSISFFIVGRFKWDQLPTDEDINRKGYLARVVSQSAEVEQSKPGNLPAKLRSATNISTILFTTFGLSFLLFFIWPTFLNNQEVYTFYQPVAGALDPIGIDGRIVRTIAKEWFLTGRSMYEIVIDETPFQTPITYLFHLPASFLSDSTAVLFRTFTILICYIFVGYYFPVLIRQTNNKLSPTITVLFMGGFISYGLQFEIERGNSNLVAYAFVMIAILLFHFGWRGKKNRLTKFVSILLFVLGAQLKLYPLIFGIFLISDWDKWRENIPRFLIYGVAFLSGFFVMGYSTFSDFLRNMTQKMEFPSSWIGNHSLYSYLSSIKEIQDPSNSSLYWFYLFLFMLCFLLIVYSAYRRKSILDPGLWLVCTIIACVLPSTSHDIKLPLIYTASIFYFVMMESSYENRKIDLLDTLIFGVIAFSVFSLMYAPENRGGIGNLASAFPFFVWMSIALAVQAVKPLIRTYRKKIRAMA